MKIPKLLIPFLAVVLPSIHFSSKDVLDNKSLKKNNTKSKNELSVDESAEQEIILRQFSDSDRFLQFAKHYSHSSHRSHSSHSSHKSHTSHQSGEHNSHTSHYSGSYDCNGCQFNVEDEEFDNKPSEDELIAFK